MDRYAVVNNKTNIIENIVNWDGESDWTVPVGFSLNKIDESDVVSDIGLKFIDGSTDKQTTGEVSDVFSTTMTGTFGSSIGYVDIASMILKTSNNSYLKYLIYFDCKWTTSNQQRDAIFRIMVDGVQVTELSDSLGGSYGGSNTMMMHTLCDCENGKNVIVQTKSSSNGGGATPVLTISNRRLSISGN